MSKKTRTRFAPSPTGELHIGNLRTALYEYLFAKKSGGVFVLRLEDTDQERKVEGSAERILELLEWVGIVPEEGLYLDNGKLKQRGDAGPYVQSERLDIYKNHALKLMADGHAFQCFCSAETLQERRKEQQAKKHKIGYDGSCHMMDHTEIEKLLDSGTPYVVRMRLPKDSEVTFTDLVRGDITFNYNDLDDFVLLKSDGFPTYHLANVVDDHLMGITHVIRGEEWISSTPKHIALYEALGWEPAQFAHIPLLLNDDKSKLSKRHGSVSVIDFKEKGYLPEALINFIALLGWNPSAEQEIYSFDELTESFDLSKVNKSGAVFNRDKLDWLNRHYIQQKTDDELVELLGLKDLDKTTLKKILAIEKERMNKLSDFGQETKFFFDGVKHDKKMLTWKKSTAEKTAEVLEKLCTYLEKHGDWSINGLESGIKKWIADQGLGNGDVLWPMRVALSGSEKSPDPFTLADLYGKEKTISLIKEAHEVLKI